MIKHYFKVALRSLARQKVLAFINVFGLSIGIACFSLFLLYAENELTFDTFHKDANNIFRVYEQSKGLNGQEPSASTSLPMPLAKAIKQDLPDVLNAVRVRGDRGTNLVRIDKTVHRVKVNYADPTFFNVFTFPIRSGNASHPLKDLHSLVITESKAKELFASENAVGRTVQIKIDTTFQPFTITAIAEDVPANSSVKFDALANFELLEHTEEGKWANGNWHGNAYSVYVQLRPGSTLPNDATTWTNFRHTYYPTEAEDFKKNGFQWQGSGAPMTYGLQPITLSHTDTRISSGDSVDIKTIWILLGIAAGVLLIACINFTTLAIGRSAGRSKEVGVRKVVGAGKKQLIFQFLSEALFLSILSTISGLLLANLLLPYFNNLSGSELKFSFRQYPQLIWLLAVLMIVVGLLTGSYPAVILSSFKPIDVLKSKVRIGGANFFTRSLVTLQFTLSIGLIISTVIIMRQTKHMSNKNPGFDKENVVLLNASEIDTKKIYPLFKQALTSHSEIAGVTSAAVGLGEGEDFWMTGFKYHEKQVTAFFNPVDRDYLSVLGMQLIAGRNFDPNLAYDTVNTVIINEAALKEFGWTLKDAVGQKLDGFSENKAPVIIGVAKNFTFRHAGEEVKPQMFIPFFDQGRPKIYVRLKSGNPAKSLALVQKIWADLVPDVPLQYNFLDEKLDALYKAEQRWSSIVGWAGGISIFLACLGLFGLAALATINRLKEISIRKVLGASISHILTLISKDFIKLVVLALFIASPVAWYFMNKWLQSFAYRIDIGWTVFVLSGVFAILIALLTIFSQAIKAAASNPVKSLKTE
jgi:putative ABC transport system permease protein